jgi:ribosomal protein L4
VKNLKVYIASMFSDKDRVKQRAAELALCGIDCTSRWAEEKIPHNVTIQECEDEYLTETAVVDVDDILAADKVVLTVPEPKMLVDATVASSSRGGRHFESGLFYGLMLAAFLRGEGSTRELIILGKKENVFHFLNGKSAAKKYPAIRVIPTWGEVKQYLVEENNVRYRNADLTGSGK